MNLDAKLIISIARKDPDLSAEVVLKKAFEAKRLEAVNGMTKDQAEKAILDGLVEKVEPVTEVLEADDSYELPDYQCPYCDEVAGSKGALTRHVKKEHKAKYKEYMSERS